MKIGLEDGEWYDEGGQSKWKLKISSPRAYSINLIFDQLSVPNGAALYIYDRNRTTVMGPIDESNSDVEGEFWTDLLPGDGIILELLGDKEALKQVKLSISKVIHGYINTFSTGFGASAPCNVDIDCPVGQPFGLSGLSY
ncbi:hypothetical protein JHJ32_09180 [Parapedobacter sp. ISTM3]|nr:hypothetical protein [Parapedobacter sp. ISTM3]MBK1440156.1 hypothetical protein [Parapedobacter sp. ISTM3]